MRFDVLLSSHNFSHKFGVVQAHRTSSNLLKMNDIRESEVCRVLSHKFGMVQAHRTSSNLQEGSRRFDALELHRTSA